MINALKRFISIRSLKKHNEPVHMGKDDLEKYKCDICGKTILNQRALKDHQLVHKDMKEIMCSYDNRVL